jgi:hypothetical protein
VPAPLRNTTLGSVAARSQGNVWVGSAIPSAKTTHDSVGHCNGHRCTLTRLRAPATTGRYHNFSMVRDGTGGIWAQG